MDNTDKKLQQLLARFVNGELLTRREKELKDKREKENKKTPTNAGVGRGFARPGQLRPRRR